MATARQRAASRKNLAKARDARRRKRDPSKTKSKGNRRKLAYAGAGAAVAGAVGYVAYRGVKKKIQSDFRSDVRSNLSRDKQHQHNQVHHHAIRQRRAGKGNRHLDPRVLDAQIVFTKKIAKARVKKRKGMTSAQRRASIPKRRRLI